MSALNYVPLVFAVLLCLPVALSPVSETVRRKTKLVAVRIFGTYAERLSRNRDRREAALHAGHVPETYRTYASKTLLYSGLLAVAGSVFGAYLLSGLLIAQEVVDEATVRALLPSTLGIVANLFRVPDLGFGELFGLLLSFSATVGVLLGLSTYALRWWWPAHRAANRRRRIEASLPRTISFMYAMSRSGMSFPRVMRILAQNRAVYGDAAAEIEVAVREMDLFGKDLLSSIQEMSERTPSDQLAEFTANLGSVLQSGRSLSTFLHEQYGRYREEAEAQQRQLLELLATLAEVYVTMLVAGPLFLITILVIIGLSLGGTLDVLRITAYGLIPLANVAFIVYLSTVTESLRATRDRIDGENPLGGVANVRRISDREELVQTDGAGGAYEHPNAERLERYDQFRSIRNAVTSPIRLLLLRPTAILWVTVPITLVWLAVRLPDAVTGFAVDLRVLDDILVRTTLFLLGSFAVVHYAHHLRVQRIERVVPDFLDRLASINDAGMTVVESLGRVRRSDLGALDEEIDRVWHDIEWGADVESALYRFERRVQTTVVTRVVTLLNNAMSSSGDLADVIRIAAEQAKEDRRLKRQRRQEMVTYLMVVYVSFMVFLVIIAALNSVLIPSLPDAQVVPGGSEGLFRGIGSVDTEAYTLVFFHTGLIQGLCSGFVAGQMGGGNARHGARHATILLAVAYLAFLLIP